MEHASAKTAGASGVLGQMAELVISLKGLVAALTVLGTLAGFYISGDEPPLDGPPPDGSSAPSSAMQASVGPALPTFTSSEGWAVVGKYAPGKLANPLISFEGSLPRVGETCEAIDTFPVYKDHPADQAGGRILLGDVHKGDTLEVLDIRRTAEKVPVFWIELRAVLHAR